MRPAQASADLGSWSKDAPMRATKAGREAISVRIDVSFQPHAGCTISVRLVLRLSNPCATANATTFSIGLATAEPRGEACQEEHDGEHSGGSDSRPDHREAVRLSCRDSVESMRDAFQIAGQFETGGDSRRAVRAARVHGEVVLQIGSGA